MKSSSIKLHPGDNVAVALTDLRKGEQVIVDGSLVSLTDDIQIKHKFSLVGLEIADEIIMYGVLVGKAKYPVPAGGLLSTYNIEHASRDFKTNESNFAWNKPDISLFKNSTFNGYHRADGRVGTANYWLVIPLVFCENRNIEELEAALVDQLGYGRSNKYSRLTQAVLDRYKNGQKTEELSADTYHIDEPERVVFPNLDGIKFLKHSGGCGGTRDDAQSLCALLAGYITHQNVAGVTVLSLGCQNAQVSMLEREIKKRDPAFSKPCIILEQQQIGKSDDLLVMAIRQTLSGIISISGQKRAPAPLSKLCIGLECGGSDGFSGISANPAIGYTSDLLVALGGSVILSEFPELCGVEQNLIDRCTDRSQAERFESLMKTYNERAHASGSGFEMNPSPGNIKDGLITDAIKSAGAAKKGGTSAVTGVLDYTEQIRNPGLNLLCTPGNDVESTTAEVASGANIVLFTTGLGTPTGNPIVPVIKIATNTSLFERMPDIIDLNTGTIIEGAETIEQAGARILNYLISVASGEVKVAAVVNGQSDFIPWKRGVSL